MGRDIDGEAAGDISGRSVSMNSAGDRVAIGANGNSSNAGHVRVYDYSNARKTYLRGKSADLGALVISSRTGSVNSPVEPARISSNGTYHTATYARH